MKNWTWILMLLGCSLNAFAGDFRGDGSIQAPGLVYFDIERAGAPKEGLRVQALVVGHRRDGALEELLVSQEIDVLPSRPSKTQLNVSEDSYQEWAGRFSKITAALRVVPTPDSKVQWQYKNLLDPKSQGIAGGVRVHGKWIAQ